MTLQTKNDDFNLSSIEEMNKMTVELMKTPHYARMGNAGIFAIMTMAKSVGADPIRCLNGGMYYINGKIEMDGRMMMSMIRQSGHSVTKDKRSDGTICILHGKRADTNDTWTESFSLDDAKQAGLLGTATWKKYTKDMLQWRALSRLARYLFPDVIGGCYVQGEISDSNLHAYVDPQKQNQYAQDIAKSCAYTSSYVEKTPEIQHVEETISAEQAQKIEELLSADQEYFGIMKKYMKNNYGSESFELFPLKKYQKLIENIESRKQKSIQAEENNEIAQ